MVNQVQKSLEEAATNVINRRLTRDDVLYFARTSMEPGRYPYMMGDYRFTNGYNDAKQDFINIIQQRLDKLSGDEFISTVINDIDRHTEHLIGNERYSRLMDNYYVKGFSFAFQEIMQFLNADIHAGGPEQVHDPAPAMYH